MIDEDRLHNQLAAIRMLILDVDGVQTDGGVNLGERDELKSFFARDGAAIKYLQRSGIEVVFISGRGSKVVARRAKELGVAECHQKALEKWPVVEALLKRRNLGIEQAAFVGDDLVDLPVMVRVGLGIAVADGADEVRRHADAVTDATGGRGAVREVAEAILRAQGKWQGIVNSYLEVDEMKDRPTG